MDQIAFKDFGVSRIFAKVFSKNAGSICVLQKVGFEQEGLLRRDVIKEGEALDVAVFGLLES